MFLFTSTSAPAETGTERPLKDALAGAARETGVSFEYLMKTAQRESNFDPSAKASSSSATGLFQFLDQTWLATLKTEGPKLGLQAASDQIVQNSSGKFSVPDAGIRKQILDLRNDPSVSAKVAGAFTAQNRSQLANALGRNPSEGELYIAHFLGAAGASNLIRLASEQPNANAASAFSDAASANRSIFYDRSGQAKSAAEVYSSLVSGHETAVTSTAPILAATTDIPAAPGQNAYRAKEGGKPMFGLFRGSDTGPVAQPIQNAWSSVGRNAYGSGGKALTATSSAAYFPGDGASGSVVAGSSLPVTKQAAALANVPSTNVFGPPSRGAVSAASVNAQRQKPGAPLDLLSFLRKPV